MSQQNATRINPPAGTGREPLTAAQAAQHLLNRRYARRSTVGYAGYIAVPGRPLSDDPDTELFAPVETNLRKHDECLLQALDDTAATPNGRLMVFMPRGAAKSTNGSVVFPSRFLGRYPEQHIMAASYGADLARRMGRRVRSIARQPRYRALFNTGLMKDSTAADRFVLENGSEYFATGMSSGGVGYRANGIIFDDPISGREAAESEIQRQAVWDQYTDDLMPCLVPGGWVVLIMTRWHQDDIAGRILPENWDGESGTFLCRDGMTWRVLCLQARCETTTDPLGRKIGEYLAPEWFPREHWLPFEAIPRNWNSLCQQRPRPIEGAFFHEEDMLDKVTKRPVPVPQKVDYVIAIVDSAVKTGRAHDGLAVMFFARSDFNCVNPPLVVLDWDLIQMKGAFLNEWLPTVFTRLEEFAKATGAFEGSAGVYIEDKVSGTILLQQAERKPEWDVHPIESGLTAMGKKERAISVSGHVAAGKVKWTEQAYTRAVTFKNATRNHAMNQVLSIAMGSKDNEADDCLDTFTYGVAITLGNSEGY